MRGPLRRIWFDEAGATIVEHAILVCAVALVFVALAGSGLSPSIALKGVAHIAETVFSGEAPAQPVPTAPGP